MVALELINHGAVGEAGAGIEAQAAVGFQVNCQAFGEAGLAQATYAQLLYTPFFLRGCFPIAISLRGATWR
jgi:hypothetical protein